MRATKAYITSFGTTGLLIASSLLSLAVMSAFVAFNGFPGQNVQDPIGTLLVQQRQAPVSVPAKPVHVHTLAATRRAAAGGRHTSARRARTPLASTGPVAHRVPSQTVSPPAGQTPASSPSSQDSQITPPVTTPTTPSVPNTGVTVPSITLPSLPPPPSTPTAPSTGSLPIDTSGVTGLLGGG